MAKIDLAKRLSSDFPQFHFVSGDDFLWSPSKQTVYFRPLDSSDDAKVLLHEVSHALLGHTNFRRDIDLLKMEREAWSYAKQTLSATYGVVIDEDDVENSLETYREWLHSRSRCTSCSATGVQTKPNRYRCPGCMVQWSVNDARRKHLRRREVAL